MDAAPVTQRFRLVLGVVVTAALFVPLAVYGAPALAKSASSASQQYRSACGEYGSSGGQYGSSCRQYRVVLCHRTHSRKHPWVRIVVSSRAVKAHLRHGDAFPPCSTLPAATKHGKAKGHGKPDHAGAEHGHR